MTTTRAATFALAIILGFPLLMALAWAVTSWHWEFIPDWQDQAFTTLLAYVVFMPLVLQQQFNPATAKGPRIARRDAMLILALLAWNLAMTPPNGLPLSEYLHMRWPGFSILALLAAAWLWQYMPVIFAQRRVRKSLQRAFFIPGIFAVGFGLAVATPQNGGLWTILILFGAGVNALFPYSLARRNPTPLVHRTLLLGETLSLAGWCAVMMFLLRPAIPAVNHSMLTLAFAGLCVAVIAALYRHRQRDKHPMALMRL